MMTRLDKAICAALVALLFTGIIVHWRYVKANARARGELSIALAVLFA